jgi:hypothetical protein
VCYQLGHAALFIYQLTAILKLVSSNLVFIDPSVAFCITFSLSKSDLLIVVTSQQNYFYIHTPLPLYIKTAYNLSELVFTRFVVIYTFEAKANFNPRQ